MEHPHQLSVIAKNKVEFERVGDEFVQEGLFRAQMKSWRVLNEIKNPIFCPEEVFAGPGLLEKSAMSSIAGSDEVNRGIGPDSTLFKNLVGDEWIVLCGNNECGHLDSSQDMPGSASLIVVKGVVVPIVF